MTEIETRAVWFSYSDGEDALKSVSITVQRGEFLALIGRNGSGKTTLAKSLLGLLRPREGEVLIQGEDIRNKPVGEIARSVGYVFQNPDHQIFSATTREEISYGPRNLLFKESEIESRTEHALERFDLIEEADKQPASLSYGTRRKVALASIYAMDPQIWILDEPTGGLDWRSEQDTMALLHELNDEGKTIVLITHNMSLVGEHAQRCAVMSDGQVIAHDDTPLLMERHEALNISPPQVWQLAHEFDHQPLSLTVEAFCKQYGEQFAAESEIHVGRA